jgi:hypothetical protein
VPNVNKNGDKYKRQEWDKPAPCIHTRNDIMASQNTVHPEISYYLENLIALTPTQHYNNAHNNARTQEISEQYQHTLLLAKVDIVEWNIQSADIETIYEFEKLLFVLRVGFDNDEIEVEDMDFPAAIREINQHYS